MADDKMADRSEVETAIGDKEEHEKAMANLKAETEHSNISEKKLLMKTDLHVIPILFLLFLCAFIDRINIGNARIQGLEEDLNMTGNDFNIALFTFFILYILLEVPSNIVLKRMRPSVFLSSIMLGWGIVTICQGCTQSFGGLVACRVVIGALEAGFFPGCIYLISMFYKRWELQWRMNLFFSASIVAGAFSGLLAYAIAHMSGIGGYRGWRWIFIIEGIATVGIAIASYWLVPDWPETAKFYSEEERAYWIRRLALDNEDTSMSHWDKRTARRVFGDPKIYLGVAMYLGIVTTGYSGSFFTPTILRQLGWTAVRAQVMSIPIFVCATILALSAAILSDKVKHRFGFIIAGCLVATTGYAILLNMHSVTVGVRYFAVFLIVGGGYIAQPITLVWLNNNLAGHYKRGVGAAMQVGLGNIGGIVASNVFLKSEQPEYPTGFGTALGMIGLCIISACIFALYLIRENRLRDNGKRDYRYEAPEHERSNMGDDCKLATRLMVLNRQITNMLHRSELPLHSVRRCRGCD